MRRRTVAGMSTAIAALVVIALGIAWTVHIRTGMAAKADQATLYALPLVIMDLTREETLARHDAMPNRFFHVPILGTDKFRTVVRPNADTLYSTAWLDLATEPMLMTVPPSDGRYFMIQCMDAWSNVFADPGIRTLGNQARTFAIVGPGWQGKLPDGVEVIHAPTRMVWVLARVYVRNRDDLPAARAYQASLDIRPLSKQGDATYQSTFPTPDQQPAQRPMMQVLQSLSAQAFFSRFVALMAAGNPPAPGDAAFVRNVLTPLGLAPGDPDAWNHLSARKQRALSKAYQRTLQGFSDRVAVERNRLVPPQNGWSHAAASATHGTYGTDYRRRAGVAMLGLAATLSADKAHFNASIDGDGDRLDGSKRYRLIFPAGDLPPVLGFWSITLYDDKGYLVPNAIHRYAIRPGEGLAHEANGAVVIYLQPDDPGAQRESNWLPTPAGQTYELSLRAFWPSDALLKNRWVPPPVMPDP